jgi:hypothetical protein
MEVLDHEPQTWFLLADGDALLLDARCSHGPVDYSVLVELNEPERAAYAVEGHAFASKLAEAIHYSAPGAKGSTSPFKSRDLSSSRSGAVNAAVSAWFQRQRA